MIMDKHLALMKPKEDSTAMGGRYIGVREGTSDTSGEVPGRRTQNGVGLKTSSTPTAGLSP